MRQKLFSQKVDSFDCHRAEQRGTRILTKIGNSTSLSIDDYAAIKLSSEETRITFDVQFSTIFHHYLQSILNLFHKTSQSISIRPFLLSKKQIFCSYRKFCSLFSKEEKKMIKMTKTRSAKLRK